MFVEPVNRQTTHVDADEETVIGRGFDATASTQEGKMLRKVRGKCFWCEKSFIRLRAEIVRQWKRGRRGFFCSLSCAASYSNSQPHRRKQNQELGKQLSNNQFGSNNPNWKGGITNSESVLRSREKYPERYRARNAVGKAIENGTIIRSRHCKRCQCKRWCEAHHEDYSKPLDITWLCEECHDIRDKEMRIEGKL